MLKEAVLYEKLPDSKVKCNLCARRCTVLDGRRGACGVRENRGGTLYTLVYGALSAFAVDPIEKKPLYHFNPGSSVASISTFGCNLFCRYCCNYVLSQTRNGFSAEAIRMSPEEVVERAKREGADGISYTYNEPTIFMEFAYDTAKLAKKEGLFNTFVTNGFMTPEAVDYIAPYLDAATVDFKGAGNPEFYRKYALAPGAEPIFESLLELKKRGIHVEVTNLVVPDVGVGDREEDVRKLARWIVDNLGPETPLHLIRFFPNYLMLTTPPTPIETLVKLHSVAKAEGLHYVYVGNVPGHKLDNTYCPGCGALLIERYGFWVSGWRLTDDLRCPSCGFKVNIKMTGRPGRPPAS